MATKPPRYVRQGLIQSRVNNEELREILTKAELYAKGNMSDYVRMACLGFRPIKREMKK